MQDTYKNYQKNYRLTRQQQNVESHNQDNQSQNTYYTDKITCYPPTD